MTYFLEKSNIKKDYELHAIIIKKNIPFEEAQKIASEIIKNPNRKFYRETESSYRFRNLSKQKFDKKTFRSKKINENITLIFGETK
jgi:hypothetical protein